MGPTVCVYILRRGAEGSSSLTAMFVRISDLGRRKGSRGLEVTITPLLEFENYIYILFVDVFSISQFVFFLSTSIMASHTDFSWLLYF